jgi:hypothetical protein
MLRRNALIALGNHLADCPADVPMQAIRSIASDPSESAALRSTAHAVLERLAMTQA